MAIGDKVFASALMRLRQAIHNQTLEAAKGALDATFKSGPDTMKRYSDVQVSLYDRTSQQLGFGGARWQAKPLGVSSMQTLSFEQVPVQRQYRSLLQNGIGNLDKGQKQPSGMQSLAGNLQQQGQDHYDESNSPLSSDYATVLAWIMDRWFLQAIPYNYLIPDPGFVPQESIRSFYVDHNWFQVFVDGALSIAEHFHEGDDVREAIKASFSSYLSTNIGDTGFKPQKPVWGLLIRSEFVTRFPDLRISAPFKDTEQNKVGNQLEVLRMETLDTDLILLLFDREPADFSPKGITISPPEHQLSSMFGGAEGMDVNGRLNIEWKQLSTVSSTPTVSVTSSSTLTLHDPNNGIWDPDCRAIVPASFVSAAVAKTKFSPDYAQAQTVAAQLVAMVPSLNILPAPSGGYQGAPMPSTSLLSSKSSLNAPLQGPSGPLKTTLPGTSSNYGAINTYSAPINAMVKAVAKLYVYDRADDILMRNFFNLAYYIGAPQHGPPVLSAPAGNTYQGGWG